MRRRSAASAAALALALVASACSATPDTPSGLSSWASQASYRSSAALLRTDVHEIETGIRLRKLLATRTACDGLGSDAASAIGELPTPDHRLTDELNDAYSDLVAAAQDCSVAGSFSASGMTRFRARAAKALGLLSDAGTRLSRLEGR